MYTTNKGLGIMMHVYSKAPAMVPPCRALKPLLLELSRIPMSELDFCDKVDPAWEMECRKRQARSPFDLEMAAVRQQLWVANRKCSAEIKSALSSNEAKKKK